MFERSIKTTRPTPGPSSASAYEISPVWLDRTIRVRLSGFFSKDDVAGFAADYKRALTQLHLPPNQHDTLADITEMNIQSQDVVAAFTLFMGDPHVQSRRLAFVISSSLSRMQAQRLTHRDSVGFFEDMAEAEAWLKDRTGLLRQ